MTDSRVILVTGSSRGIGAVIVSGFAKKGFRTVINFSKSAGEAAALQKQISETTGRENVLLIKADVSNRSEVRAMFDEVVRTFGKVDALINNAGVNKDGPFLDMTDEQWQKVMGVNLTGTFICSQEFALHFKGDSGNIINISASTGIRGRKNGCNYCASKAGVINLTKCLALELAPRIRVNCIVPGYIETDEVMTRYKIDRKENYAAAVSTIPLGRMGTAEDIFSMAEYLVENSGYITGQNFFVNGGHFMY